MHEMTLAPEHGHEGQHPIARQRSGSPAKAHKGSRRTFRVHGKVADDAACLNLRLRIVSPDGNFLSFKWSQPASSAVTALAYLSRQLHIHTCTALL